VNPPVLDHLRHRQNNPIVPTCHVVWSSVTARASALASRSGGDPATGAGVGAKLDITGDIEFQTYMVVLAPVLVWHLWFDQARNARTASMRAAI
jgi:hypothetical protein